MDYIGFFLRNRISAFLGIESLKNLCINNFLTDLTLLFKTNYRMIKVTELHINNTIFFNIAKLLTVNTWNNQQSKYLFILFSNIKLYMYNVHAYGLELYSFNQQQKWITFLHVFYYTNSYSMETKKFHIW